MADQNAPSPAAGGVPPSTDRQSDAGEKGRKIIIAAAAALVLVVGGIAACSMLNSGPTDNEARLQDLAMIAGILESYKQRTGAYPQPTLRREDASGVRHVWGYRPGVPALASCTLVVDARDTADARASVCGGDIYDADGNIIGWKGTITVESALNVLKSVRDDVPVQSPLSGFAPGGIPIDPQYRGTGTVEQQGFGEYVYAVLAPQDGSLERGGLEYQLAATVLDAAGGELKTFIRGTYFASADRPSYPSSLIGPGPFMNEHRKPVSPDLHHVLVHGQGFGTPNPGLGQGDDLLERLRIQNSLHGFLEALDRRLKFLDGRSPLSRSEQVFADALEDLLEEGRRMEREYVKGQGDLQRFRAEVQESAIALAAAADAFLNGKVEEVRTELLSHQDAPALGDETHALIAAIRGAEEQLLLARDEILRYLGGEGIEDQVRARAVRKVRAALDSLQELQERDPPLVSPFLKEEEQQRLTEILETELARGRPEPDSPPLPDEEEVLPKGKILVIELHSAIRQLTNELTVVLNDIATQLQVQGVLLGEVDRKFRLVLTALAEELGSIEKRFKNLAGGDDVTTFLSVVDSLATRGEKISALRVVARASGEFGDFSGVSFPVSFLNAIQLLPQAGVPDLDKVESATEASYSGIPYPLPGLNELYARIQKREEQTQRMREEEVRKRLEEQVQESEETEEAEETEEIEESKEAEEPAPEEDIVPETATGSSEGEGSALD